MPPLLWDSWTAVVMAIAERLGARAIVTLDERDFGAVTLAGEPALWPEGSVGAAHWRGPVSRGRAKTRRCG